MNAIVYTRRNCHLCDEAVTLLQQYGVSVSLVDIDEDTDEGRQLREKFTECVPVVEINGRVRFRGRINEVLLRRLMR
ncbi:MAG: glutaredoxin family protein [Planctomycetales bacterium]|nr:glutaredoxin family protein [Planctomycetales bacterium]